MSKAIELTFVSNGINCAADLYWPSNPGEQVPCIVMAHGGSGTKRLGLPRYAERFSAKGMAVFIFDYRCFGLSEGEPRQFINVQWQREDYRSAVEFVRSYPGIDKNRIALWGTSLSGGHVLDVASSDSSIAAVVSQVPLIDGLHRGRNLSERLTWDVTLRTLQFLGAAIRDKAHDLIGLPPFLVPVVDDPGKLAVFTGHEAKVTFDKLGGENVGWVNALAPRFFLSLPRYETGTAEKIKAPTLVCIADNDQQASAKFSSEIAERIPDIKVLHFPVGHFDVYVDPMFEMICGAQTDFLRSHLVM